MLLWLENNEFGHIFIHFQNITFNKNIYVCEATFNNKHYMFHLIIMLDVLATSYELTFTSVCLSNIYYLSTIFVQKLNSKIKMFAVIN